MSEDRHNQDRSDGNGPGGRTTAEWITFAVSCGVQAVLCLLIVVGFDRDSPAAPSAQPVEVREEDGSFHLVVEVHNRGGHGAANVQVVAELTIEGDTEDGDAVIDFLSGDERERVTFVFTEDPADGDLSVRVASYETP